MESEVQAIYQQRFKDHELYRERVWKILCDNFFARLIDKEGSLLDLGAGWGEFSRNVACATKYAMDLNPDCGSRLHNDTTFLNQDCSLPWPIDPNSLDVVFTSNFLEHLPSKEAVTDTLSEVYRCLKPGGKLIALGPNVTYLAKSYWDFWDHHVPISGHSLTEVLTIHKFSILQRVDRFLPYQMSDGRQAPPILLKLYLRLPLLWPIIGKQFLIVAQK